jgi:hypothetical protein
MHKKYSKAFAVLMLATVHVDAAPLDALLSAHPFHQAGDMAFEASYDAMNSTLDVLGVRAKDTQYAGTNVGDYSGAHVRAGYALTDNFSLDGGYWKRKISYRQDNESVDSWQAAAQYRLYGDENSAAHYAIRLGVWGNQSGVLSKTSPTLFMGKTLNSVNVNNPQDAQIQLDTIGTWKLAEQTELSAFAGAGSSWIATGDMTANYTNGAGCNYNLTFTPNGTSGVLTVPCSAPVVITNFTTNQSITQEFSYRSNYYQLGGSLRWQKNDWILRGGYQFQHLNRNNVDVLIVSSGGVAYKNNHILLADVSYKLMPKVAVFTRVQVMSNQFVGEIPFAYNAVTAGKFNRRYGFASFGVNVDF